MPDGHGRAADDSEGREPTPHPARLTLPQLRPPRHAQATRNATKASRGLGALHVRKEAEEISGLVERAQPLPTVMGVLPANPVAAAVEQRPELDQLLVAGRSRTLQFIAEQERLAQAIGILGGKNGSGRAGGRHRSFGRGNGRRSGWERSSVSLYPTTSG